MEMLKKFSEMCLHKYNASAHTWFVCSSIQQTHHMLTVRLLYNSLYPDWNPHPSKLY